MEGVCTLVFRWWIVLLQRSFQSVEIKISSYNNKLEELEKKRKSLQFEYGMRIMQLEGVPATNTGICPEC